MINKYEIIDVISKGSFGKIFKIKFNNNFYAMKKDNNLDILNHEINIYKDLREVKYISKLYDFFSTNEGHFMVIDFFEENLFEYKNRSLNSENYELIIIDLFTILIDTIKNIHIKGYVHRDLKPLNICLKNGSPYLIDFGLSKKIIENGKHIKEKNIKSIIGSYSFLSKNVINNIEPSRRDDIASIIYILIYMFIENEKTNNFVGYKFEISKNEELLQNMKLIKLKSIETILLYIMRMKFTQEPNYDYIIKNLFVL